MDGNPSRASAMDTLEAEKVDELQPKPSIEEATCTCGNSEYLGVCWLCATAALGNKEVRRGGGGMQEGSLGGYRIIRQGHRGTN